MAKKKNVFYEEGIEVTSARLSEMKTRAKNEYNTIRKDEQMNLKKKYDGYPIWFWRLFYPKRKTLKCSIHLPKQFLNTREDGKAEALRGKG